MSACSASERGHVVWDALDVAGHGDLRALDDRERPVGEGHGATGCDRGHCSPLLVTPGDQEGAP